MKASQWQPRQRVRINQTGARSGHDHRKNSGTTTDRAPEKIDGLIKIEVQRDDGDLVLLPVHLIQNV